MTFWDFCAPIYDLSMKANGSAYAKMLDIMRDLVPQGATVLEVAAGTGAISISVSKRASRVRCTDISKPMLNVAKRKAKKAGVDNISFGTENIFELATPNASFDVVIAGQVFHLIDAPEKAAAEVKRVAKSTVIMPLAFTKNLQGMARLKFQLYKAFGFSPKIELASDEYERFLASIGFENCRFIQIEGRLPMSIAVWQQK